MAEQMSRLEELRIKNPGIRFYSVKDKEFARYGCIVEHDFSGIAEMMSTICSSLYPPNHTFGVADSPYL